MRKLYIKPCDGVPIDSLPILIDSLFRSTETNDRRKYARPTFSDKECTKYECTASRRSFEDLLALSQTYFPQTTEKDLMRVLKTLGLRFYCCFDIHKIVFHFNGWYYLTAENLNELAARNYSYVDGTYTPEDLLRIYNEK